MRRPLAAIQALNGSFWLLSIALFALILVVPFLQIDRNFNITPSLSLTGVTSTWDSALLSALWNSVVLSVIASLFAIFCGSAVQRIIDRKPRWMLMLIIAVYAVNPVARALSYFDLFQIYTPVYDWSVAFLGRRFATTILLPAVILGIHYFPIYLMRNLFVLKKHNIPHGLPPLYETLFDDIPLWVRGFPISFALFFLLTFFDYWVIQVISGNTVLYWTPLFIQKGFQARAVSEAALMIVIGLLVTAAAYLAALCLSTVIRMLLRALRPLWFKRFCGVPEKVRWIGNALACVILCFLAWPCINTILMLIIIAREGTFTLIQDTGRAISVMAILGIGIGAISATGGLLLSAVFQENAQRFRWWLPALYFLALVPEAAYVLFSLFVTGSGLLRGNPLWMALLMLSFSVPISFFLWESLWGSSERQKLWLLGVAMQKHPLAALGTAYREWRKQWGVVFIVLFWLTIDNVFITDFAAGPKWKPLAAVVFNATKRGFSSDEFLSSFLGTLTVIGVILATLWASQKRHRSGYEA